MNIGARIGAWAKSGYTARDYVQTGLVALFDGIENNGYGLHTAGARTSLRDLVSGSAYAQSGQSHDDDSLTTTGATTYIARDNSAITNIAGAVTGEDGFTMQWLSLTSNETNREMYLYETQYEALSIYADGRVGLWGIDYNRARVKFAETGKFTKEDWFVNYITVSYDPITLQITRHYPNESGVLVSDSAYSSTETEEYRRSCGYRYLRAIDSNTVWSNGRKLHAVRFYNRALTAAEVAANYAIDKARFNLS